MSTQSDFLSHNNEVTNDWSNRLKQNLGQVTAPLALTSVEYNGIEATAQEMADISGNVGITGAAYHAAVEKSENMNEPGGAKDRMRGFVKMIKAKPGYTTDIGKLLGIIGSPVSAVDPENYKAVMTLKVAGNLVRVKFVKHGVDYVNIYRRKKGSAEWAFVTRYTHSPYDDHLILATPGQPEHWEYISYGVKDDKEIGQPSDIQQVVFGASV